MTKKTALNSKYLAVLENYLLWLRCKTAMWQFEISTRGIDTLINIPFDSLGPSAETCIFEFETFGKRPSTCSDPDLLFRYRKGKANRDWWTKEKGWWDKCSIYIQEDWLDRLLPEC